MKILFFSRRFSPDIGGVEKHVFEIGKRLIKNGHEIIVVTQSQGKEKKLEGIRIIRIPQTPEGVLEKTYIWKWLFTNRNLIKQADLVHAHDVYFWYFPFRFLFPFKKSFLTFHGYESYPIKRNAVIIRKLSEYLASGNIIVGDFIKKWYGTKPAYVIYGGIGISNFKFPISNKIKKDSAVFIGRLDAQTGILEYAEATRIIKKKFPEFELLIVGDGEYKNKLKDFRTIGFVEDGQKYFKRYNFAFVSRYLSILEALANKKLVFAMFDNPIKEDYLRMSPFAKFIVIEGNPDKLSKKAIFYLKNEKESDKLVNAGYEWVKKQTWENIVKKYFNLWKM